MFDKIKKFTVDDKNNLLSKTFYVLPDNPSNKHFSPSQIRKKGYEGYLVLFEFLNSVIDAINNSFDISNEKFNEHVNWFSEAINDILAKINDLESGGSFNIVDGTGTNAVQMKQDGTSGVFSFTDKNPNATAIDETLTGDITYGAPGDFATSVGGKASAQGKRSMAQGTTTIAKGDYSHSEGNATVALAANAHAEGAITTASGSTSHAEGQSTQAKGENSHAEGMSTVAEGVGSHSEGFRTQAKGNYSHAEGYATQALHEESHASGYYTKTGMPMQTVCGAYNIGRNNTFFEIGNGNATKSENAFEVYLDGHAEVQTVGETDKSIINREALNQVVTNINEKLEGKKSTYILDCTWDLEYLKTWISRGRKVEDASGTDVSGLISMGNFWGNPQNNLFNSNDEKVLSNGITDIVLIVLKPTKNNMSVNYPFAETFIIDTFGKIFEQGDAILITQPNVPDRWYAGSSMGFYALEARKIDLTNVPKLDENNTFTGINSFSNVLDVADGSIGFEGNSALYAEDGDVIIGGGLIEVLPGTVEFCGGTVETWLSNENNQNREFAVYDCLDNPLLVISGGTDDGSGESYNLDPELFIKELYDFHGHRYVTANEVSGGTKLYKHTITCSWGTVVVISTSSIQSLPEGTVLNAFKPSSGATQSVQGCILWNYGGGQVTFRGLSATDVGGDIKNPGGAQWTQWNIEEM